MLRSLIGFCVRQPLLILFAAIAIAAFGGYCALNIPIDAIPNVGENQVIVFTEWPGRSPKDVEDQVTYPLSVALLTVPHAESVRGKCMFGYSFVQITFDDGVDFYWARSRVLERLGTAIATLPEGVTPTLGPDATALGQIFYYVLEGPPGMNLAELRTMQDYVVKYELQSVRGVSEVASVGGYVRQYQIEVDPDALRFHDVTMESIWRQINAVATLPGVTPASPLQPIEGRVVMLQSGIKAPMAVRVYGDSLDGLAQAARLVADRLRRIPQVNGATVNPDIVLGVPYVEFEVDRDSAARYGMSTMAVNQIIETALGGMNLTQTVEGRERYPVRIRYQRDLRDQIDKLARLPVVTETGGVVPLENLAKMNTTWGPGMIGSEDARLVAHVAFAPSGMVGDLETVEAVENQLRQAQEDGSLKLPAGYSLLAVGSFQNQIEANRRLVVIIPIVIVADLLIIYLNFRNLPLTLIIFSQIPIAFFGGMIGLGLAGIEMNTAIWVGLIALIGIAEDDGVVIATYMEQLVARRPMRSIQDVRDATVEAGRRRIRPSLMTAFTTFAALLPVMLATGRGADVARAMALPVFFGMLIELVSLFVVPVLYCGYLETRLNLAPSDDPAS